MSIQYRFKEVVKDQHLKEAANSIMHLRFDLMRQMETQFSLCSNYFKSTNMTMIQRCHNKLLSPICSPSYSYSWTIHYYEYVNIAGKSKMWNRSSTCSLYSIAWKGQQFSQNLSLTCFDFCRHITKPNFKDGGGTCSSNENFIPS